MGLGPICSSLPVITHSSEGPGINPEDNLSAVGAALTNLGRIAPIANSDYEKIDPLSQQFDSSRVLIVRLGAMGDILHALPAVAALRRAHPKWYLGWAVEPRWRPLLCGDDGDMPLVDRTHLVKAKEWARAPLPSRDAARDRRLAPRTAGRALRPLYRSAGSRAFGPRRPAFRRPPDDRRRPAARVGRTLALRREGGNPGSACNRASHGSLRRGCWGTAFCRFSPPCRATAWRKSGRRKCCVGQAGRWSC